MSRVKAETRHAINEVQEVVYNITKELNANVQELEKLGIKGLTKKLKTLTDRLEAWTEL